MEWNQRKELILSKLDLSTLKKYDKVDNLSDLKGMNLDQLGDTLSYTTKRRLSPNDRKIVFELIQKIKEKVSPLSIEYLRYLILTSSGFKHSDAVEMNTSHYGSVYTKAQMRKIKSILKEFVGFKIETRIAQRKEISSVKGSLVRTNRIKQYNFLVF